VFWAEGITDAKTLEEGREQDIFKDLWRKGKMRMGSELSSKSLY
jgi:hypothetical protein